MPRLSWDDPGSRLFQTGVDRAVLYPKNGNPAAWNGLVGVSQRPDGGVPESYYAEGRKYQTVSTPEEFEGTIRAFTYPQAFEACDGSLALMPGFLAQQQDRKPFDLTYRTLVGNDVLGLEYGYKLHFIYNAMVLPSEKSFNTLGDEVEPQEFEWEFTTTAVTVAPSMRPSSHFILDSTRAPEKVMLEVETRLYGTSTTEPRMVTADEVLGIFSDEGTFAVIDNGDGSFTISGSDREVSQDAMGIYTINHASVRVNDDSTFTVGS